MQMIVVMLSVPTYHRSVKTLYKPNHNTAELNSVTGHQDHHHEGSGRAGGGVDNSILCSHHAQTDDGCDKTNQ